MDEGKTKCTVKANWLDGFKIESIQQFVRNDNFPPSCPYNLCKTLCKTLDLFLARDRINANMLQENVLLRARRKQPASKSEGWAL